VGLAVGGRLRTDLLAMCIPPESGASHFLVSVLGVPLRAAGANLVAVLCRILPLSRRACRILAVPLVLAPASLVLIRRPVRKTPRAVGTSVGAVTAAYRTVRGIWVVSARELLFALRTNNLKGHRSLLLRCRAPGELAPRAGAFPVGIIARQERLAG
jgi:hypothetical protein